MSRRIKRPDTPSIGPWVRAVPFLADDVFAPPGLSDRQRQTVRDAAARLRLRPRMTLYEQQTPAKWVFLVSEGVVKTYRDLPSGKRRISNFPFPGDVFGLSRKGEYVNSAQTITAATLYRIPVERLIELLRHDPDLQFVFLTKLAQELRNAQRRSIITGRRDAAGRLAMFLEGVRAHYPDSERTHVIPLVMTRSDIAGYLSLSLEAVSRAAAELERRHLVSFKERGVARVLDEKRLAQLASTV
jgi:CRP/FNR family transcriptional regulator, anaerobic regulatory protein